MGRDPSAVAAPLPEPVLAPIAGTEPGWDVIEARASFGWGDCSMKLINCQILPSSKQCWTKFLNCKECKKVKTRKVSRGGRDASPVPEPESGTRPEPTSGPIYPADQCPWRDEMGSLLQLQNLSPDLTRNPSLSPVPILPSPWTSPTAATPWSA